MPTIREIQYKDNSLNNQRSRGHNYKIRHKPRNYEEEGRTFNLIIYVFTKTWIQNNPIYILFSATQLELSARAHASRLLTAVSNTSTDQHSSNVISVKISCAGITLALRNRANINNLVIYVDRFHFTFEKIFSHIKEWPAQWQYT